MNGAADVPNFDTPGADEYVQTQPLEKNDIISLNDYRSNSKQMEASVIGKSVVFSTTSLIPGIFEPGLKV